MYAATVQHIWIAGSGQRERRDRARQLADGRRVLMIDAHRRLRGPYTAVGSLLRALDREVLGWDPVFLQRHTIAILCAAPEFGTFLGASERTLTSVASPSERTRVYTKARTLRISHGIVEVLRRYAEQLGPGSPVVVFDNVDQADPTDLEFLTVALRRLPATHAQLIVCGADPLPDGLTGPLGRYARNEPRPPRLPAGHPNGDQEALAAAYIAGDCVSDDPDLLTAYDELDPIRRAELHDQRAASLSATCEPSLSRGAIPFHLVRGTDPDGTRLARLRHTVDHLHGMGFYAATIELAEHARSLTEPGERLWWLFTTKIASSLTALDRPDEAVPLYEELRERSTEPEIHMGVAHAMAMLHIRDHQRAKRWANLAIAIARLLPDEKQRAFQTAFHRDGLAVIEARLGNAEAALRLVTEGIEQLDTVLEPTEYALHRSVLRHNRAQVLAGMGRLEEALADFDTVIELDPNYAEYHFDRATLLRRLDRHADALADYDKAIELSPPFPEVYHHRGNLWAELGEVSKALADFDYALELAPDFLAALIDRARLLCERADPAAAWTDVRAGLELDPGNARMLCVRGSLLAEQGDIDAALRSYTEAVAADPELVAGWANLGLLHYKTGRLEQSLIDLTEALAHGGSAEVRYHRGVVLQALSQWDRAEQDFAQVLDVIDEPDVRVRLRECRRRVHSSA